MRGGSILLLPPHVGNPRVNSAAVFFYIYLSSVPLTRFANGSFFFIASQLYFPLRADSYFTSQIPLVPGRLLCVVERERERETDAGQRRSCEIIFVPRSYFRWHSREDDCDISQPALLELKNNNGNNNNNNINTSVRPTTLSR